MDGKPKTTKLIAILRDLSKPHATAPSSVYADYCGRAADELERLLAREAGWNVSAYPNASAYNPTALYSAQPMGDWAAHASADKRRSIDRGGMDLSEAEKHGR